MQIPDDLEFSEGKLHPGPRVFFGADVMVDSRSVVFGGGENAASDKMDDGWIARVE